MHRLLTFLFFAATFFNAAAQKNAGTVSFAGNTLSFVIPAGMDTMPAAMVQVKYQKKPDAKTAYYGNADFSFSVVVTEIASDISEAVMLQLKAQLLQQLGKQRFTENSVLTINGHKIIAVAYNTTVPGNKIFNRHIFVTAADKLFTVAFNTTETDLIKRKAQIEKSIRSVIIK